MKETNQSKPNKPSLPSMTDADKKSMIDANLKQIELSVSEKEKEKCAKALLKMFENGISLGEAMGLGENDLSQIYRFAYSQFYAGQYSIACELFKILFKLKPTLNELATAIGICHHRMGHHQLAVSAYLVAGTMVEADPMPYFYAYDCFKHLQLPEKAFLMLMTVIEKSADQPQYAKLKDKAQILLDTIIKENSNKDLKEDLKTF